jgi:carbonic anhydrase
LNNILPGLPPFDPQLSPAERTAQAIESNVRWTVHQILETPEAKLRLAEGNVTIAGALFEIATGR